MVVFPHIKINIGLTVTGKRPDGFHNLESVFYPVPWNDVLEVIPAPDGNDAFTLSGLPVPGDLTENLCWRACVLLRQDHALPPVAMHLHKVLPMGAGLGGGSADGTFALMALNQRFDLGLGAAELREYAAQLGSDCPYFVEAQPAFVSGRGERLAPLDLSLAGHFMVVIFPGFGVATAEAFRGLTPRPAATDLRELTALPLEQWRGVVHNQFEETVFPLHPQLQALKELLYRAGAEYASMSGSGSAVYGLARAPFNVPELPEGHTMWSGTL